jgi:hypothetical protein
MAEKPTSPFSGLDKALLRPSKRREVEEAPPEAPEVLSDMIPEEPLPEPEASLPTVEHASMIASMHQSQIANEQAAIEAIRKAVKLSGKEVSFARLSLAEKQQLAEIVYSYKRQGKRTSENEITRIAINYVLRDYGERGEQSILARVIEALLA